MKEEELSVKLYDAIQNCAKDLPIGWEIVFSLESGSGDVKLFNPDGDELEYPSNHEYLHESFEDALECALEMEKERNEKRGTN